MRASPGIAVNIWAPISRILRSRGLRRAFLVLGAGLIVALGVRLQVLEAEVKSLRDQIRHSEMAPREGRWLATFRVGTLSGDSVTLGETADGRNQLLIFFTTTCDFCRSSLGAWQRITDELSKDSAGAHVVWIALSNRDSTAAYVARHNVLAKIAIPRDGKLRRSYGVHGVPMTVVIDHRGMVRYTRPAVLRSDTAIDSILVAARRVWTAADTDAPVVERIPPPSG